MGEEGGKQESFFWDGYPWVMSSKSGSEEKHEGGSSKGLINEIVTKNEDKMKVINDKGKSEIEEVSEHDLHIWTERERRKKMRNMFHQLHSLLPHLPPKADKSTIIEEAATYIKTLEQTLEKLQTKKLERLHDLSTNTIGNGALLVQTENLSLNSSTREAFLADHYGFVSLDPFSIYSPTVFQTWTSANVTLNVCGLDAHFSICSIPKPGLITAICFVLEKHKLEIISAQISSDHFKSLFLIHVQANVGDQFLEMFPYEEVYKKAATEITLWVGSISS